MYYFDTAKDPRLLFSQKIINKLESIIRNIKLHRSEREELLDIIHRMKSTMKQIIYSYLPKEELIKSTMFKEYHKILDELKKKFQAIIKNLEEKELLTARFIQFILWNLESLDHRIISLPDDLTSAVDYKFVKVLSAMKHPRAKNLLITRATDGTRNYEVVTNDLTVRSGDVLLFAVLPPRDFFGIVSQGMFLGGEKIRRGTENVVGNTTSLSENEKRNLKSIIIQFLKE